MGWTPDRLPDLKGKTYVITGGNSGLGLEAAKILAGKGGRVVITARSADKAAEAVAVVRAAAPGAEVDFVLLDLADLDSVAVGGGGAAGGVRPDRRDDQQRGRHADAAAADEAGLRAADRHEPLRPLQAERRAVRRAGGVRRARRAGGQRRPRDGQDRPRRPRLRAPRLRPHRGLLPVEAGERDVRLRAAAAAGGPRQPRGRDPLPPRATPRPTSSRPVSAWTAAASCFG
jgi:NAD(P)-dependent dehydrogenase (short-subunit alcohol dehydrogenase family)